jgi:hypothetical protein
MEVYEDMRQRELCRPLLERVSEGTTGDEQIDDTCR